MLRVNWKLAIALGFVCAAAIAVTSTEAQSARKKPVNRGVAADQHVYQSSSASAYYGAPVRSGGINFDSRMGANYNPNQ
jgi:hypothetical protein